MSFETSSKQRPADTRSDAPAATGFAFLDMMLQMQKASQQALSSFIPLASSSALTTGARFDERGNGKSSSRVSNSVEIIPVGEEAFHVGTRTVHGDTTRLRRIVVETPVEQQVALRTETVVVERRKPASSIPNGDILTEKSIEMSDSFEVVETWKSVHLREEVVLRTEVVEHTETVRDTVRHDEVKVEQANLASRRELETSNREEKLPGIQAVAKQISNNIESARSGAEVRTQDAVPPATAKSETERPAPAPTPARATAEPNAQDRKPNLSQPENKPLLVR